MLRLRAASKQDLIWNGILNGGSMKGYEDVIRLALWKGADVSNYQLYSACLGGNLNIVKNSDFKGLSRVP
jgi:hypothetical protein